MISSLNFPNKYFLGLLFCIVSSIGATVRNCTNSPTHLTTIKEVFGSEERKYCRYLGAKRLWIEQNETITVMQIYLVLENTGTLFSKNRGAFCN